MTTTTTTTTTRCTLAFLMALATVMVQTQAIDRTGCSTPRRTDRCADMTNRVSFNCICYNFCEKEGNAFDWTCNPTDASFVNNCPKKNLVTGCVMADRDGFATQPGKPAPTAPGTFVFQPKPPTSPPLPLPVPPPTKAPSPALIGFPVSPPLPSPISPAIVPRPPVLPPASPPVPPPVPEAPVPSTATGGGAIFFFTPVPPPVPEPTTTTGTFDLNWEAVETEASGTAMGRFSGLVALLLGAVSPLCALFV